MAAVGQPTASELEGGIGSKRVEIVGVLVAAADGEDASPDHVGEAVGDPRRIATVGDQQGQPLGDPETLLRQAQQHHPAIRREPSTIKGSRDFLSSDGWKAKGEDRIVDHGERGGV